MLSSHTSYTGDTDGEAPRYNKETRERRQAGYFDHEEEEGKDVEKRAAGEEEQAGYFLSDENNNQVWFSSRRKRQIAYFDREELLQKDNGLKDTDNSDVVPHLRGQRRTKRQAGYFDKVSSKFSFVCEICQQSVELPQSHQ